jgi:two-component system, LuxR family, response regulator FixJ
LPLIVDIVEDDDAVRDSLCALLEAYGHTARGYASAALYLDRAAAPGHCLIVDLHMPEMTGLELLETLRSQDVRVPALIMTGRHDPSLEPRIARAGVVKLLHKPVQDEQLFGSIEQACAGTVHEYPVI